MRGSQDGRMLVTLAAFVLSMAVVLGGGFYLFGPRSGPKGFVKKLQDCGLNLDGCQVRNVGSETGQGTTGETDEFAQDLGPGTRVVELNGRGFTSVVITFTARESFDKFVKMLVAYQVEAQQSEESDPSSVPAIRMACYEYPHAVLIHSDNPAGELLAAARKAMPACEVVDLTAPPAPAPSAEAPTPAW